ncbi:MAG: MFS transporter [Deltaproteobacteria bacterium]|nr:MFS transporter [Deltaproteobacteria bacterium]
MRRPLVMALVWFFCLGGLGIWFPLYTLFLHENAGLSGAEVGRVMAIIPLVGIFSQPFWGQVADRTGSRTRVLSLLAVGAAAGYLGLGFAEGFGELLLATALLAFFWTAVIPNCVAVTLALAHHAGPRAFGYSRVWGTVGFLLLVVTFPFVLDAWQARQGLDALRSAALSEPGLEIMFPLTALVIGSGGLVALALPRGGAVSVRAERGDWHQLVRHGPYLRVVLFTLLGYLCLQGPQVFFPVFVRSHGGDVDTIARMWLPMLALEIPLVAFSGVTLERFGARALLGVGAFAGGLRWLVCGLAPDLAWVWPAQLLHGVVVAGLVLGGPLYVEQCVPQQLRSTGQTSLTMLGFGLGGIVSNLLTGWLVDLQGPAAPYVVGGIGGIVLGLAVPLLLPRPRRPASA